MNGDAKSGQLVVVGTGIQTVGQITNEAVAWLSRADVVFHVVSDPVALGLIDRLASGRHRSLAPLYDQYESRRETYDAMTETICSAVTDGQLVVGAFYGHPGVFSTVPHESVERVRREGRRAFMLPGISAEDCLFADLGVDPAATGCVSVDATDYLINDRRFDTSANLVLWQIGRVAVYDAGAGNSDPEALTALVSKLAELYSMDHLVAVYAAAIEPGRAPEITWIPLAGLPAMPTRNAHTLLVPPARPVAPDERFMRFRTSPR